MERRAPKFSFKKRREPEKFSVALKTFVNTVEWKWAKTYADTWPHWYIKVEDVSNSLFVKLLHHIRDNGAVGNFYNSRNIYYEEDGWVYWTLYSPFKKYDYPYEEEPIINRCPKEDTYEARLLSGRLPKPKLA